MRTPEDELRDVDICLGVQDDAAGKAREAAVRKWNLEARMDTDTMLNKKAARGRRFSWACQQCKVFIAFDMRFVVMARV